MTATTPGVELQRLAADLLRFHWTVTDGEELVGHVKADFVLSQADFGQVRTMVGECKDHQRPLTVEQVSDVWAKYGPLIASGKVQGVLLVTRCGVVANAAAFVRDTPGLFHQTVADLQREVIAFDPYLRSLVATYEDLSEGLAAYFVEPLADTGVSLIDVVRGWLAEPSASALAILGSYGQGKSSFALRLSAALAEEALADRRARLPILVQLADLASDQTIDAVMARTLSTRANVSGYSWHAFAQMNVAGHLVVICDGFDEMRDGLTASALRHNFEEIRRLVADRTKVIVLGRPTAFVSDSEQHQMLDDVEGLSRPDRAPSDKAFRQIAMAPWSPDAVQTFLTRYLPWRARAAPESGDLDEELANCKALVSHPGIADLASRPLQLRMLVDTLPHWSGSFDELTRASLYSHWIDLIIERDTTKRDRELFSVAERRRFAREAAMWLWCTSSKMRVEPRDLPDEILDSFRPAGQTADAALRSLVGGCFLDRRIGGTLVIPHRSFQEMLVAEELLLGRWADDRKLSVHWGRVLNERVNPEIVQFMIGMLDEAACKQFATHLQHYRGRMNSELLLALAQHPEVLWRQFENEQDTADYAPWWPLTLVHTGDIRVGKSLLERLHLVDGAERVTLQYCAALLLGLLQLQEDSMALAALSNVLKRRQDTVVDVATLRSSDETTAELTDDRVRVRRVPDEVSALAQHLLVESAPYGKGSILNLSGLRGALGDVLDGFGLPVQSWRRSRHVDLPMDSLSGLPAGWRELLLASRPLV